MGGWRPWRVRWISLPKLGSRRPPADRRPGHGRHPLRGYPRRAGRGLARRASTTSRTTASRRSSRSASTSNCCARPCRRRWNCRSIAPCALGGIRRSCISSTVRRARTWCLAKAIPVGLGVDGQQPVADAGQMLEQQPPGRLRIPLQERRDDGRMVLIILPPLGLGQAALLQAVPVGLVARGIDGLAVVDQQRVLGGAKDREMQRARPNARTPPCPWRRCSCAGWSRFPARSAVVARWAARAAACGSMINRTSMMSVGLASFRRPTNSRVRPAGIALTKVPRPTIRTRRLSSSRSARRMVLRARL